MGNAIWIFIGIAIIQAVVGAVAKSAEKRKKAEAAKQMLEARAAEAEGRTTGAAPSPPLDTRARANATARRRLEELQAAKKAKAQARLETLRMKRLKALRRRSGQDGGIAVSSGPAANRARSAASEPPPVAKPSVETRRSSAARAQPVQKPETPRGPVNRESAGRSPKPRPESKQRQPNRAPKQAPRTPARRSFSSRSPRRGGTARNLRSRLRTSSGFREALLLGELLKPPVGLRPPGGEIN